MHDRPSNARLSEEDVADALTTLTGWSRDGDALTRTFTFDTFPDAIAFIQALAPEAEVLDHHPELFNVYNRVDVRLTTHDTGGISALDVALAKKLSAL